MNKKRFGQFEINSEKEEAKINNYISELLGLEQKLEQKTSKQADLKAEMKRLNKGIKYIRKGGMASDLIRNYDVEIDTSDTEEITPPIYEDKLSDNYLEEYNKAALLDKENYVKFFGTEEDKLALQAEKDAIENDKKAKQLEIIAIAEKEEKAKKLAEELEIKRRAEKIIKEKNSALEKELLIFKDARKEYKIILKKLKNNLEIATSLKNSASFYSFEELNLINSITLNFSETTKSLDSFLANNTEVPSTSSEIEYVLEHLENLNSAKTKLDELNVNLSELISKGERYKGRKYSMAVTANIYHTYKEMLGFMFDYIENNLIESNYTFTVPMETTKFNNIDVLYSFVVRRTIIKGVSKTDIKINISKSYAPNESNKFLEGVAVTKDTYKDYLMTSEHEEEVFLKVISRQWNDFKGNNNEVKQGIKNKFLEVSKESNVKEFLSTWEVN